MHTLVLTAMLIAASDAPAASDQSPTPTPERIAVGVTVEPAYEVGADFWFLSAIRVAGPVIGWIAFDVEAGNVAGASNKFVRYRHHYRGRLRIRNPTEDPGVSQYWIAGFFAVPADKFVRTKAAFERRVFTGLTFGYGAEAPIGSRLRIWNEVGADGGESIRVFVTAGVKYRF